MLLQSSVASFWKVAFIGLIVGGALICSADTTCCTLAGVELVRKVSCAGANTAKNPSRVTDVALRPPRRQSSLDREAGQEADGQQCSWRRNFSFTVSANNWELY